MHLGHKIMSTAAQPWPRHLLGGRWNDLCQTIVILLPFRRLSQTQQRQDPKTLGGLWGIRSGLVHDRPCCASSLMNCNQVLVRWRFTNFSKDQDGTADLVLQRHPRDTCMRINATCLEQRIKRQLTSKHISPVKVH